MTTRSNLCTRPRLALTLLLAVHFLSFYGTKAVNAGWPHRSLELAADRALPFWPAFVVIYVLAFVQWAWCYFWLYRRQPEAFCRVAWASVLAEIPAAVCFLVIPTAIQRPVLADEGLFGHLLSIIYASDTPTNCFPSLHCLQSWLCWRGLQLASGRKGWYDRVNLIFTLLVCASTVLVRQHFLVDIPSGILFAEFGLLLSGRLCRGKKGLSHEAGC